MLKVLPAPKVSEWNISELSGGLNLQDLEYKLRDNQSPDCKNVWFNNRVLCKRWGTEKVNATPTGSAVLAMYDKFFLGNIIFASGTSLYKMDPTTGTTTQIYTGMAANRGYFYRYSNGLLYMNGHDYLRFDGTTVVTVASFAYVPVVCINRTPTGGGNVYPDTDDYNRMTPAFTNKFTGNGSAVAYQLTDQNLDSTTIKCTIGGATKIEGTDFTVNRTTGVVTFTTAPAGGTTNNVVITAYKTQSSWMAPILNSRHVIHFGNRLFFCGDGTSTYYWSDVEKPEYMPVNQFNVLYVTDGYLTGFGTQNNQLIVFKDASIFQITYKWDDTNSLAQFPVEPVNMSIGCDAPATIALINNKLTWLTSGLGPMTLVNQINTSGSETVYRNVNAIGRNINGNSARAGLLSEPNLKSAVAIDHDQKYWIAVNGKVYLWDYGISPYSDRQNVDEAQMALSWWLFDGLDIQCFCHDGTDLYFGDSSGYIQHFVSSFNDSGAAIPAYWRMKVNHLGAPNILKNIQKIWFACRSDVASALNITYYTDNRPDGIADSQPIVIAGLWDLDNWDLGDWYLGGAAWFGMWRKTPPMRNVEAFSVKFSNSNANEDLNVSDIIVAFTSIREVRRSV